MDLKVDEEYFTFDGATDFFVKFTGHSRNKIENNMKRNDDFIYYLSVGMQHYYLCIRKGKIVCLYGTGEDELIYQFFFRDTMEYDRDTTMNELRKSILRVAEEYNKH